MAASPLLGYNTNVRHLGKLYHIQTEDSGTDHAHIFTHLFADGGRIIASKKTTYRQHLASSEFPDLVKRLMRESHKAMFIALRDGLFDEDEAAGAKAMAAMPITVEPDAPAVDVAALERAADARLQSSAAAVRPRASSSGSIAAPPVPRRPDTGAARYGSTYPAARKVKSRPPPRPDPVTESIFGGELVSEKSLDEVILSYLAEDLEAER